MLLPGGFKVFQKLPLFTPTFLWGSCVYWKPRCPQSQLCQRTGERGESMGQGSAPPACCWQTVHEGGTVILSQWHEFTQGQSRGAGTTVLVVTRGLGTSDSACSGGSRPECCWALQELIQQGLGCSGCVHPLANRLA